MLNIIYLAIALVISVIIYFVRDYFNPYTDEIIKTGNIIDDNKRTIGYFNLYKRTYKNGKVKYVEKNYL